MFIKHLGRKAPKILSAGIQFADGDDVFKEQEHEKPDEGSGGGGTVVKEEKKPADYDARKAAFFSKHSASHNAPPELGGSVSNEGNKGRIEQAKADDAKKQEQERIQREQGAKKREGSNVPKILEEKRAAEKERDELKRKSEEFETKVRPELDKKIAELEAKISGGDLSPAKEKEFQDKITKLESEKQQREESLVNENSKLRDKLKFYDLQNDETFHSEFVQPVVDAHGAAVKALGGDQAKIAAFQRALIANSAALRSESPEEAQRAIKERNSIMSGIVQEMDEFAADSFKRAALDYIARAEKHAIALSQHEKTTAEIREKSRKQAERGQADLMDSWNKAYKTTTETYKPEETLADEDAKIAKDLGLDVKADLERANVTAQKVVVGQSTMMEAIDIVHRGRIYPVLKAKNAVLEKKVADQAALIAKLRKSGTGGGESNGTGGDKKPEKQTREQFHAKYSANRPGLRGS